METIYGTYLWCLSVEAGASSATDASSEAEKWSQTPKWQKYVFSPNIPPPMPITIPAVVTSAIKAGGRLSTSCTVLTCPVQWHDATQSRTQTRTYIHTYIFVGCKLLDMLACASMRQADALRVRTCQSWLGSCLAMPHLHALQVVGSWFWLCSHEHLVTCGSYLPKAAGLRFDLQRHRVH